MKVSTFSFFFFLVISISACKTNQFNRAGKPHGYWKYTDTLGTQVYQHSGRYKNGIERGTWKYYLDGKIARKEKYRQNVSYNQFFYENGKVNYQGKSQLDVSEAEIHWYRFGDWEYFDVRGRLTVVKTYEKGKQVKARAVK